MSETDDKKKSPRGRPKKLPDSDATNYPSIRLLENIVNIYKQLSDSTDKNRTIKDFEENNPNFQSIYKDISKLEEFMGGRPIFTRVRGQGTYATTEQAKILDEIEEIVDRIKRLRQSDKTKRIRLRVATSVMLSIRVARGLIDSYLNKFDDDSKPEVDIVLASPNALASMAGKTNSHNLILTFATKGWQFDRDIILDDVKAHRCILVRRDHEFVREYKELIEKKGNFQFSMLSGLRIAMLDDDQRIPDFSRDDVERYAEIISTSSTLESHAHIRSGTADITFSHKDILSEDDLKHLCSIDLSRVGDETLKGTRLCLLKGGRRVFGEETEKLKGLTETLLSYFRGIHKRFEKAEHIKNILQNYFPYSYHTSFLPVEEAISAKQGSKKVTRIKSTWLRSKIAWEVNIPPSGSGKEDGDIDYQIGGKQTFKGYKSEEKSLLFFGRAVKLESDSSQSVRHVWRPSFFELETAVFNVVMDMERLSDREYLFGNWFGTPTWIKNQEIQIGGCVIFHRNPNFLDPSRLNDIVENERKKIKEYYNYINTNMDPHNIWRIPDIIEGAPIEGDFFDTSR